MRDLFASGHVVDLIVGLTAIEAVALGTYWRRTGRGVAPADLLPGLLAGVFLLLAVRAVLVGSLWPAVGGWLFAGLLAHLADLRRRWRSV